MKLTLANKLTGISLALVFCGLVACNDQSDTGSKESASTDNSLMDNTTGSGHAKDKSSAGTAKTTKKRKTSIFMPVTDNDKMIKDKEGVYNKAQVMPEFPGGQDALSNYVNDHINYPQQAIDNNTAGTIQVSFVVDEKGKIKNARVINADKLGNGLDEEALRVVSSMPAWKPGTIKGKNVKTRLQLPINFQVEG